MSPTARSLLFLLRAIELDTRRTFMAALERDILQTRARILADRLIGGRP